MSVRNGLLLVGMVPQYVLGAEAPTHAPVVSGGSIATMLMALAATLALIAGAAWLMRRLPQRAFGAPTLLKVISSVAVGTRERVVVVEAGDTWLVLGVAPGRVSALHQFPRQEPGIPGNDAPTPAHRFAGWLKSAVDRRSGA